MKFLRFRKNETAVVKTKLTYATELSAYADRKGFEKNSFAHLRQPIKKKKALPSLKFNFHFSKKIITALVIGLISFASIIIAINSELFSIKEILIVGESDSAFNQQLEAEFLNKKIILIKTADIENQIRDIIPNVDYVFVRKVLPDKLEIQFERINPVAYLNSFDYSAIFDSEGRVRSINKIASPLILSEVEIDLIDNRISSDNNIIEQTILNSLTPEEVENFKWEDVSQEKRIDVLNTLKYEVNQKIINFKNNLVLDSEFPVIFFFEQYDFSDVDKKIEEIELALDLMQIFSSKEKFEIKYCEWITQRTLQITLENGKEFYFSSLKSFDEQENNLRILLNSELIDSGQKFDLRTNTISIV